MALTFQLSGACPNCGQRTMQSVIEAHPNLRDLALKNFRCAGCGPVKTKVLSLKPRASKSEAAA
jgi:uncharacterized Zn finger protein